MPLVPVTPIKPMRSLGWFQKAAANSPAHLATGSGTTTTASPDSGGLAAAAAAPIRTTAAPSTRALGQKLPPSTRPPGRPMNTLPGLTHRESQVIDSITASAKPRGTGKPTECSKAWSVWVIAGSPQMGFLIRTWLSGANSGANLPQPSAQSIPTQSGGHARKLRFLQDQNRHFKVVTRSQGSCTIGRVDINHNEFQGKDVLFEVEISQALFQPLTETTTCPAVERQSPGINRGRGHSRRG